MGLQYVEEMNGRLVPEDEALAGGNSMHRVPMGMGCAVIGWSYS